MLRIYNLKQNQGKIELKDTINFQNGIFSTGYNGYGEIHNNLNKTMEASYVLVSLKSFKEYLKSVKLKNGALQDFILYNVLSEEMLKENYKDIKKNETTYKRLKLNEEAILLFTELVNLQYEDNSLIERLYGRFPETGMYLLYPNATIKAYTECFHRYTEASFEALQSKNLGHQLVLTKLRNI